ncbi:MAG: GNAT family N-acetyltransferase [Rhizobiales bacterium]|nr:GNAT family N-acetyltransferase [Hyphomicrobiales bacterium]
MGERHRTIVTHLEMLAEPKLPHIPRPRGKYALLRADKPPVHFYRYLYNTIGESYLWVNRRRLSDAALAVAIQDERVEIYVLYVNGAPAGFFELDFRHMPRADLNFLGMMPEHIGMGLGKFLLGEAITMAWAHRPNRLIVQTCTLDHPSALPLYQKFGFNPCGQEVVELEGL